MNKDKNTVVLDRERVVRLTDESVQRAAEMLGVETLEQVSAKLRDTPNSLDKEAFRWWMFLVSDDPWLTPSAMRLILDDFLRGGWHWRLRVRRLERMRPKLEQAHNEYLERRR